MLARLSGTVTALPAVGDVIRRGGRLYAVDGEPVLLMYGAVPAYRTLAEGVGDGRDVEQLERNLAALGYDPGTVDEDFTDATAAAVAAWQRAPRARSRAARSSSAGSPSCAGRSG